MWTAIRASADSSVASPRGGPAIRRFYPTPTPYRRRHTRGATALPEGANLLHVGIERSRHRAVAPGPRVAMLSGMDFATGTVLDGRYRVEAQLAEGGMGRVYRCEDVRSGVQVAVKVLRAELGRDPDATRRFEREAMGSTRLEHVNIVRVEGSGVLDDGACYLVMELLTGETLAE